MLKWARRIAIFLLLGAIVNVAVAWGCLAWHSTAKRSPARYHDPYNGELLVSVTARFGFQYVTNTRVSREWSAQIGNTSTPYPGNVWWHSARSGQPVRTFCGAGWPMLALMTWQCWDAKDFEAHYWGIPWLPDRDPRLMQIDQPALPLYPMWSGFALNTLFYAIILEVAFRMPVASRRWLRARCSLCPACAYPRGTSPVCTECGQPHPRPR
ncbi:MAG: hypothetical protein IT430_00085 [Phycisphaerales bacterium]|nr:hypothetical protein [Phycisphaerales bacterium]